MNKTKICTRCKRRKPRTSFYLRNQARGWCFSECIPCSNKFRKKRKEKELGRKLGKRAKLYTAKELQNLKDAYMRGLSYNQMELLFKSRTRHALESKLSELGVATRRNYMLKRETGIEATVREWLQAWGLDFATQVPISNMVVDFCKDFLVIEVLGSYWHSDKRLYPKGPKYAHQKLAVRRDAKRRRYLLQHGYSILYIWEYDLEHNLQETKKALQVVLNSDVWNNNRPISVELLRDNTEITKSITKGDLAS